MLTLEHIKQLAATGTVFDFYSPDHPNWGLPGAHFEAALDGLSDEEKVHLCRHTLHMVTGDAHTSDPIIAWALLNAPAHLGVEPGVWANPNANTTTPSQVVFHVPAARPVGPAARIRGRGKGK